MWVRCRGARGRWRRAWSTCTWCTRWCTGTSRWVWVNVCGLGVGVHGVGGRRHEAPAPGARSGARRHQGGRAGGLAERHTYATNNRVSNTICAPGWARGPLQLQAYRGPLMIISPKHVLTSPCPIPPCPPTIHSPPTCCSSVCPFRPRGKGRRGLRTRTAGAS